MQRLLKPLRSEYSKCAIITIETILKAKFSNK